MSASASLEPVIGLEVHAQLLTASKMFCACSAQYAGAAPNTHVCEVCAAMPGALPVINRRAVESTVLTALALQCTVPEHSKFDRKNYSYPDLPKGYQISQYDRPIGERGVLEFDVEGVTHRCHVVRVHLEEDTGKSTHITDRGEDASLIDYNRSGIPLMEIVSEPDLTSAAAAREYFSALRRILMYLGVCDGNLQEGSMRADVNISLGERGGPLGSKVEIKNLNSFSAVQRAIDFEIHRQGAILREGGRIPQETRGWSEKDQATLGQRTKEYAHDYRYFPEPDLPPLRLSPEYISSLRSALPELPAAVRDRFVSQYGVSPYTAGVLTDERALAEYFEQTVAGVGDMPAVAVANWVTGELRAQRSERGVSTEEMLVRPASLAGLLRLVHSGQLSGNAAKTVLAAMFETDEAPQSIADRLDLRQISDEGALLATIDEVLRSNAGLVSSYRGGKSNVLQALVGKVMAATRGKASPQLAKDLLLRRLEE